MVDLPKHRRHGMCVVSRLVNGEAVRLELLHHTLFHRGGWPFLILQRIGNVEHVPFRTPQLVESKHIDMFHCVAERLADLRHILNVFLG